jgi:hypothetical protein
MGRSISKPFILIALPTICVFFALDTPSQSPETTAHSTYEQKSNWVRNPATISDEIAAPAEQQAFRTLTKTPDPAERLRRAEEFLSAYPQSWVLAQVYALAANGQWKRSFMIAP